MRASDRVGILCRNRTVFFELLFACAKLGAILVPLNWRSTRFELKNILQDATPKLVFTQTSERESIDGLIDDAQLIPLDPEDAFNAACAACSPAPLLTCWPGEQPWYLLYTSGTSGAPKAVVQNVQMAVYNYMNVRQAIDLHNDDVTLNYLPLFHTAGINLYTLPILMAGGEIKLLPSFDVDRVCDLLSSGAIDVFFGVPTVYQEIARHPKFSAFDFLNCVIGAAAAHP